MSLKAKRILIALLGASFLASLLYVQGMEVARKKEEAGLIPKHIASPEGSERCVECHEKETPGIIEHWKGSTHAIKGIGCMECHKANEGDVDAFMHENALIATLVTPRDCGECHVKEFEQFHGSHHARAGNILHSLDNKLAEVVEGAQAILDVHASVPGHQKIMTKVDGRAFAYTGCQQCHGSKVALQSVDGGTISSTDLDPDPETGQPRDLDAVAKIATNDDGKPLFFQETWPNTGIGRLNLDGSKGACSACHSRHDFSPRRARQPENCGKCHLGPDHPQKEIYEESKHGIAYRDLKDKMNLDAKTWVLGKDYSAAPTCATCHMSGNSKNDGLVSHDPGLRISWTNRPPVSLVMDTDKHGKAVAETDPEKRRELVVEKASVKRDRMKNVCSHCHARDTINGFYKQYDNFVVLYNEKFGKPGKAIMAKLKEQGLITPTPFDEEIEWTWFYLWHHEGRRARHGASMMAPDYAHWHGTYEVAERFYVEMIPQAREIIKEAREHGKTAEADAVEKLIDEILARPEHKWQAAGEPPAEASETTEATETTEPESE